MLEKYLDRSMSFTEYLALIDRLLAEKKTTGPKQSEAMFNYGKLNRQRMARIDKTFELEPEFRDQVEAFDVNMTWLMITEGWCGDAAQNIPVIERLAAANKGIRTRYVLRDDYPELMDMYLTEGSRSIPKLIAIDNATGAVLGTWGPRPEPAQEYFREMRATGVASSLIHENLQRWYLADRGRALQFEIVNLLSEWSGRGLTLAA